MIVIETKWRSHEEDVDELSNWMTGALKQAQRNRHQVVQLLNWQHSDHPLLVQALVVLWGPDVSHDSAEAILADGVNVTAGRTSVTIWQRWPICGSRPPRSTRCTRN